MNKLLFNEKQYIDNIVKNHNKNNIDISLYQLIYLLVVYYYQQIGYTDKFLLSKAVNQQLELIQLDGYYYERYYKVIDNIIKTVIKYNIKLKDVYTVPIYQSEYDIIQQCGSRKHQKILATLYMIAHWYDNDGWTPNKCQTSHIKKMANVNCTTKEFNSIIHDLIVGGYITIPRKANQSCYKLNYFEKDKNIAEKLQFTSFNNIGNIFIASQSNTYITCESCGRLVKKMSPRQKYCKKCAEQMHKKLDKVYHEQIRKQ